VISTGKGLWQTVAVLSFLPALLFKEMALTLPVIVLLIELTNREEGIGRRFRSNAGMWLGLGLVFLVYVSLRVHALGAFSRTVLPLPMPLWDRALTTAYLAGRYLQDLLLPVGQNAYHVFRPFSWLSPSQWLLPLVLLIAQGGLAWMFWRKKETKLLFLTCFTVVSLAPVLNIGGVGQNVYTERYLYIPSLGFCLMAGTAAVRLCRDRIVLTGIGAALVLAFSLLTVLRNPVWRDNRSLYQSTVKSSPDSALMRNNLGKLYFADRDLAAARSEFRAALEADSRAFARSHSDQATSLLGLGSAASAEGDLDVAWKYAEQASRMKAAVHRSDAFMLMGMVLAKKQSYQEAEKLLRYAIELRPGNEAAHVNLGNVFLGRGDWAGAEREFRTAVGLNPKAPGALISLAILLSRTQRHEEAARLVREVLALDPRNPHAVRLQRQLESGH
jgi:tetratricopeptide (TPR) repeat protein